MVTDSSNAGTKNGETSIVEALREREQSANSGTVAYRPNGVGVHGKRWVSALNGRRVSSDYFWGHYLWGP